MAENEAQTTGTPEQDGGDAAEVQPTTGTPETDGRNAVADSNINRDEALAWKAKAERLNEAERELQELRARLQPPAADDDDDLELAHLQRCQQEVAEAKARGERPPTWAVRDLRSYEREQQMAQVLGVVFEKLPDDAKAAVKEYAANPAKYPGGIKQAQAELQRQSLEKAQTDQAALIAQLKAENERLKANRVSPDTVRTSGSEGPTSAPEKQTMTRAQWLERQQSLSADDRMAEQRMRSKGLIDVQG